MAKGMKGYENQKDGGYSKYDAASAPVKKNGGNKAIHVGVESKGEKYPRANAKGRGKTE